MTTALGGCFLYTSPAGDSSFGNALRSLRVTSLSVALSPTSSSLITLITLITACSNLCLSSSNSAGDRANSPWCTWNIEQQLVKEKMVRAEELIRSASRIPLEDKPSVRGGRDCKELSWSGEDSGWSCGMTSPRNRFSSQRKEEVCEEAGNNPEACACLKKIEKKLPVWQQSYKISKGSMKAKTTLYQFLFPLRKAEVQSC